VSVPYRADFKRTDAHPSNLYYGASVGALEHLGRLRGYRLVCGNRAGNNLFFVREAFAGDLPRRTAAECWMQSRFREARDPSGALLRSRADQSRGLVEHLPVVDVVSGETHALRELWGRRA